MLLPAHSSAGRCSTEPRVRRASGAANADETGSLGRLRKSPFIHRKKSLPGLRQKNACKWSYFTGSVGIRICRDVFQKARPAETSSQTLFPCKWARADARTRTGDPFITRMDE